MLLLTLFLPILSSAGPLVRDYVYADPPADNPLRGLVPYLDAEHPDRFPHSMKFHYFTLNQILKAEGEYDWKPVEAALEKSRKAGCQLTFRIYIEFPGRENGLPRFLSEKGVEITEWESDDGTSYTPDYEHPAMQKALVDFITALGSRYNSDQRIACLTAGLLGLWGEWHNYPREELWASKETQNLILDAYERAFPDTDVLLRYPSAGSEQYASTNSRPFGYHDDSFAWGTLDTGKESDNWYFMPLVNAADAADVWKTQPIGGEIRPELWQKSFTKQWHDKAQDFEECIRATHASWLMDSGFFDGRFEVSEERKKNGLHAISEMGYVFHVDGLKTDPNDPALLKIKVTNLGVAPFYRSWPVFLRDISTDKDLLVKNVDFGALLPGVTQTWSVRMNTAVEVANLRLVIPNPMSGGKSLRFANAEESEEGLALFPNQTTAPVVREAVGRTSRP